MTDSTDSESELANAVREDFGAGSLRNRVATMLLAVGLIAFGFLFGVGYYAAIVNAELPLTFAVQYSDTVDALNARYTQAIIIGVVVAGVTLTSWVWLTVTHPSDTPGGGDA